MSKQQQPKDPADVLFVCSLEDLNCLHDYMVAAMAGNDISELPRLWNQEIGVIRSRPHPAPQAPDEHYTGTCAMQEKCIDYADFCESIMDELTENEDEDPPCPIKCAKRVNPHKADCTEAARKARAQWESELKSPCGTVSPICTEKAKGIIRQAREGESVRWATALNTLIATESKRKDRESVDMVYSYRIEQVIESLRHHSEQQEQPR